MTAGTGSTTDLRLLQHVVLPEDKDLDVLPLYVDYEAAPSMTNAADGDAPIVVRGNAVDQRPENILSRRSLRLEPGTRVSLASYFNAFPASYWRRWSTLDKVVLRVAIDGEATVIVYRSMADGRSQRVDAAVSNPDGVDVHEFELPLTQFADGGWYWFDLIAGGAGAVLREADWLAPAETALPEAGSATIGITTFNRPDYCLALLRQIAEAPEAMSVLDQVVVVDQGDQNVADQKGFAEVEAAFGGRLRIIYQPNLGGSGGFARSMVETLDAGVSRYVLLLDDDIVAEPEGIRRAVVFADWARTPTIVGGHMFSMFARSSLHSLGEVVNRWRFFWGSAPKVETDHDFGQAGLRATGWLHRRVDVDYNGWWMCLIPVEVLRKVGLSLPFFIKWDDSEFGLRAGESSFPTVSLPGVAVWHVPWTDKDDALDWQAYYHQRNRFVAALLHSPYPRGGRMVQESLNHQVKHILAMQYSTAELRLLALEDLLRGPSHLHEDLPGKLAQVRAVRADFDDARTSRDPAAFPLPKRRRPPRRGKEPEEPTGRVGMATAALAGVVRQLRPVDDGAAERPEATVPYSEARWWRLGQLDSAVVSTADGGSTSWYRRDRARFADLMRRSVLVHRQLAAAWPRLREEYLLALPELTSPEAWRSTTRQPVD